MDLAASTAATSGAQSIEWLFKKERMYLLAQFWQQVRASANTRDRLDCGPPLSEIPQHHDIVDGYLGMFSELWCAKGSMDILACA